METSLNTMHECLKRQKGYKAKHPNYNTNGVICLFRVSRECYECYNEDADALCKIQGMDAPKDYGCTRVAGFPHHRLDYYLPKIIRANYRLIIDECN